MSTAKRKSFLEVALNGPWTTRRQPRIPVTQADIVAQAVECARLGASVVHLHAYDASGAPADTYELYAPIFEAIKSRIDVICYPTIPIEVAQSRDVADAGRRYAAVRQLAAAGLIEWCVVDPGAVHIATFDELAQGGSGFLYANSPLDVREGLAACATHGLVPSYAIYEPGFLRAGAAFHRLSGQGAPRPIYRFMFSDAFSFGLPPAAESVTAYAKLLASCDPGAPWMLAGLGVELSGLWEMTAALGGGVRVGLEDAPLGTEASNPQLVAHASHALATLGVELATAGELRVMLGQDGGALTS